MRATANWKDERNCSSPDELSGREVTLRWQKQLIQLLSATTRFLRNIGAASVHLTADDLREIESAASKIEV